MDLGSISNDTICAVATPPGVGGISVVRLSGESSLKIVSQLTPRLPQKPEPNKVYFSKLFSFKDKTDLIDEVLVTYFEKGHSFTGEEVCEISCHGSPIICERILEQIFLLGARPAEKGEFSFRAFMNGKIDLVQAESILATIHSQSKRASILNTRNLTGVLSRQLSQVEEKLLNSLALIETSIDFTTEDIDIIDRSKFLGVLESIQNSLDQLVSSYKQGRLITEGVQVILVGRPNAGKSSLLNIFMEDEVAIVTHIPGTTRDLLTGDTQFRGIKYRFIDTAGVREAVDEIEKIGIERGVKARSKADIVILVVDSNAGLGPEDLDVINSIEPERLLLICNKVDLGGSAKEDILDLVRGKIIQDQIIFGSANDPKMRELVLGKIFQKFSLQDSGHDVVLNHSRQHEKLSKALGLLKQSMQMFSDGDGYEYIAIELKQALLCVQEVIGKRYDDDVMDKVFSDFCIGK